MKYNVGDRVRIKSLDWYNKNKNKDGIVDCGNANFIPDMVVSCGDILTICDVNEDLSYYYMKGSRCAFKDEMIEGLVEEETKFSTASNPIEIRSNANCLTQERVDEMSLDKAGQITDFEYEGLAYTLPDGYQFVDEHGNVINATKIVLEKKKKEYPKTYEECCKVLQYGEILKIYPPSNADVPEYDALGLFDLLESLRKLIICRDVYWKIAGEEMGLGKPWEPDWTDDNAKYSIYTIKGALTKAISCYDGAILTFPTEEMRDAFKENFDPDIEICKELL